MTVRELIEILEDFEEAHGEDTEVRLLTQPNWPLEYEIDSVKPASEEDNEMQEGKPILFLLEGRQIGYGMNLWDS